MMDALLVSILAEIAAAQARIAGMQAENQHRADCGNGVAYGEDAFSAEAQGLQNLAVAARNAV